MEIYVVIHNYFEYNSEYSEYDNLEQRKTSHLSRDTALEAAKVLSKDIDKYSNEEDGTYADSYYVISETVLP